MWTKNTMMPIEKSIQHKQNANAFKKVGKIAFVLFICLVSQIYVFLL